jgi:hypothetical protein
MDLSHRIKKAFSSDTYSLDAAVRNVNRLKWSLKNLLAYLRTLRKTYLDPSARSQLIERKRKMRVEELLAQLDERELEGIRLRYADGSDSIWSKYLDARKWLARNIDYAERFGWILDPPRDTLDLGCGAGYFPFVMRQLGPRDSPCVLISAQGNPWPAGSVQGFRRPDTRARKCHRFGRGRSARRCIGHVLGSDCRTPPLGQTPTAWRVYARQRPGPNDLP